MVISRNSVDGDEVTHFQITGITNGSLYKNDGTSISNDEFITFAEGNAGLKFLSDPDFNGTGYITIQASTDNTISGLGDNQVTATVVVAAVNDSPVIDSLWFDFPVFKSDNYYHLAEDTVDIGFGIKFSDIDSDGDLNNDPYTLNDLNWTFHKLDNESVKRVFASKTENSFVIDSLFHNFNGVTGLQVSVMDEEGLHDTLNIPIYIDQRNDTLQQFSLHTPIKEYSIDSTTLDSVREKLYFRLPQDDEGKKQAPA